MIDDPSGNSFIENVNAPLADPALSVSHYQRSKQEDHFLGIYQEELKAISEEDESSGDIYAQMTLPTNIIDIEMFSLEDSEEAQEKPAAEDLKDEVLQFGTNCPSCNAPCETNMKVTSKCYSLNRRQNTRVAVEDVSVNLLVWFLLM